MYFAGRAGLFKKTQRAYDAIDRHRDMRLQAISFNELIENAWIGALEVRDQLPDSSAFHIDRRGHAGQFRQSAWEEESCHSTLCSRGPFRHKASIIALGFIGRCFMRTPVAR